MINEKKLWQNVILTAILDALCTTQNQCKYIQKNATDARNWLLYNSNWYFTVCNMADIDAKRLRNAIHEIIHNDKNNPFDKIKKQKKTFLGN